MDMDSTCPISGMLLHCSYLSINIIYSIYTKYLDRQAGTNSVDPDQMLQNAASDQGLHCLPLIQQFLDKSIDSKMELFKF